MSSQLHAGQLRFHDFSKLRELQQQRPHEKLGITTRPFLTAFANRLRNNTTDVGSTNIDQTLKLKERAAAAAPDVADAQFNFLHDLNQIYPQAVVQRFSQTQYVMDQRCAAIYLNAMQKTQNFRDFNMDRLISRLKHSGTEPLLIDSLRELALHNKGMDRSKQVAAVLNVLGNPMITGAGGGLPGGMAGAGSLVGGHTARSPLHVQLVQSNGNNFWGVTRHVLVLIIVVSAISALMDSKGIGGGSLGGMNSTKHINEAEGSDVRFDDVKGVAEAKAELEEIVDYLKDPSKFTRLGGKLPRGLLLTGPPGTGKTMLAKAIAGEAGVPFFYSSGSQFEEVYVGLGAKRVRELFEQAKKKSPAIIFIDEIDAVGGSRKLKDQSALKMTLNELLVQLDGFDENNGIIVIGATNFAETLDDALLRPGRFDKHVSVPLPDVGGRKEILEVYAKKTKLAKDVDLSVIARGTVGFSGADLYNLMNQAALKAAVDGLNSVTMPVLEYAKDKIMMGAERKTAVITAKTAKCTAYHEAGHAIVAVLTDGASSVHKATIMPRGNSLGMVSMLPDGDQTSQSWKEMMAFMDVAMGGRVAEELIFGEENITSGASSDIQAATRVARNMVTKLGFSNEVGIVFHGGAVGEETASDETRSKIDQEVRKLTQGSYDRAKALLQKHSKAHHLLAEALLEYETLTGDEVRDIVMKGVKPKREIVNKNKGARGDTTMLKESSPTSSGNKTPISGWGLRVDESSPDSDTK